MLSMNYEAVGDYIFLTARSYKFFLELFKGFSPSAIPFILISGISCNCFQLYGIFQWTWFVANFIILYFILKKIK